MNPVIALVENDLPTNRALARLLRISGFTVESFLSAELYLARPAAPAPGCLLLDIDLDGMSGLELQARLGRGPGAVPVVVLTGRHDEDTLAQAQALGCSSFLHKPVRAQVLVDAIVHALAERPAAP